MTPDCVTALLAEAGIRISAGSIEVLRRENRWLARLPENRVAWFPVDEFGAVLLRREARVLEVLKAQCAFAVPRIVLQNPAGWQLRTLVPGLCTPWQLYERTRTDPALARRIGRQIGAILAEQHAVTPGEAAAWLPQRPPWPEPAATLRLKLPDVVDDPDLLRRMERVICRYETDNEASADRVLVHGDLGFHNIALDPANDIVAGVFDYADASWSDRHQDFRYLVFPNDANEQAVLDGALEVYEAVLGMTLDRRLIHLCNAGCAIGFLAHRQGTPPEAVSCGRTLAEDLAWVRSALASVGPI